MATFTVEGDIDPFLRCEMDGEAIYCESDAMAMMDDALELSATTRGGIGEGLKRALLLGESFFLQKIETARGPGSCLLAPAFCGGLKVIDLERGQRVMVGDRSFVACAAGVEIRRSFQRLGQAFFGQTGGLIIMSAEGKGQLAVAGKGKIATVKCSPANPLTVDAGHVVAWDGNLGYEITLKTGRRRARGMASTLANSAFSGEGIVLRFTGEGHIHICSRPKPARAQNAVAQGM